MVASAGTIRRILLLTVVAGTTASLLIAQTPDLPALARAGDWRRIQAMGPGVMPELSRLYSSSSEADRTTIASVFYALGWRSAEAKRALMADAHTKNRALRLQVQWALGRVSADPDVVDVLLDNMQNDLEPLFRDKAACALANDQIHLSPAQKVRLFEGLIGALDDPKPQVRQIASSPCRSSPARRRASTPAAAVGTQQAAIDAWQAWLAEYKRHALMLLAIPLARPGPSSRATASTTTRWPPGPTPSRSGRGHGTAGRQGPGSPQLVLPPERLSLGRAHGRRRRRRLPGAAGILPRPHDRPLYFHFAFLTTDPREELNIALAGPRYFVVQKDGIAFWLGRGTGCSSTTRTACSRSSWAVEAFVWYGVDVAYDLDGGTYSLTVKREGEGRPLADSPGSAERRPTARLRGGQVLVRGAPFSDASSVTYYVDDVVLGTDEQVARLPFVAPGRRKLFFEMFTEYRRLLQEKPRCLPVAAPADLGFSDEDLAALRRDGFLFTLQKLLAREDVDIDAFLKEKAGRNNALQAMVDWNEGCAALEQGEPELAFLHFKRAEKARPAAPIYTLSSVLALARLKRYADADERLARLAAVWRDDARFAVASAYVGVARGDLDRAEEWLRAPAGRLLDREMSPLLRLLRSGAITLDLLEALKRELTDQFQERLEETLVAEQYFYVLLWQGRFDLARGYAVRMAERLSRAGVPTTLWYEHAGDAAFGGRDLDVASELYATAEKGEPGRRSILLKQADIAYLTGDLARERVLRERFYGRLAEE